MKFRITGNWKSLFLILPLLFLLAKTVKASTANLESLLCYFEDSGSTDCQTAISADGGTSFTIGKGEHIDVTMDSLSNITTVNSATLNYDTSGILSADYAVYLRETRNGTIICSDTTAPENANETRNTVSCDSVTPSQLGTGVWFQLSNNDDKGPEDIVLDYVFLNVDYTASSVSISLNTDGSVSFGTLSADTQEETTAYGIEDVETISVDTGPADLDVKSSVFSDGTHTWSLGASNGDEQVQWEFSNDGFSWSTFTAADTLYSLDTNVSEGGTSDLYLSITTPTSTAYLAEYSATVTIVASSP